MNMIGYARVSTATQDFASQLDALRAAGCNQIIRETASGARDDREALTGIIEALGEGDVLVVTRLDRLARSLRKLIELVQIFEDRKISLISLADNIDTSSAAGKLTFHIFAALAEFERNLIRERTQAGLDAARAAGKTGGRPRALNESQIEKARIWITQGNMTQQQAAGALGVSRSTLSRALGLLQPSPSSLEKQL